MIGIVVFVFGLIFGSFLGVVIDRLPKGESIVFGRSHCNVCQRDLSAPELIPVLSYFIQGGKCKQCHTKLSLRYPLLEILTALAYLFAYLHFGMGIEFVFSLIFTSILIIIAFIDLDTMIIYDRFHVLILMLGFIEAFIFKKNFLHLILASFVVSVPLLIVALVTGGMGGGDIKLMFVSGFYLGVRRILVGFIVSVIVGGSYGIYTLVTKKHSGKDAIPFGPFLCLGLYVSMLYGIQISTWYLSLIG